MKVINASAAATLLEQRPEFFFSGLCSSSVTAELALIASAGYFKTSHIYLTIKFLLYFFGRMWPKRVQASRCTGK